jgi:hypothetical protein
MKRLRRKDVAVHGLIAVAAIGIGVVVNTSLGEQASDILISKDVAADSRIVVVTFDTVGDFGTGVVPHLRATFYRDIARQARQNGARAVGFVDFDSLSFSDGEGGRSNVVASDATHRRVALIDW